MGGAEEPTKCHHKRACAHTHAHTHTYCMYILIQRTSIQILTHKMPLQKRKILHSTDSTFPSVFKPWQQSTGHDAFFFFLQAQDISSKAINRPERFRAYEEQQHARTCTTHCFYSVIMSGALHSQLATSNKCILAQPASSNC